MSGGTCTPTNMYKVDDKVNPYGLTEFDIEEIDELLNIESNPDKEVINKD